MLGWLRRHTANTPAPAGSFRHLFPGQRYHVVRPFLDHDQVGHPVGEQWIFLKHGFLPYEDGLTLFVLLPDGRETSFRMQWRPEAQGRIVDALDTYLSATPPVRKTVAIALTRDSVAMGDDIDAPHPGMLEVDGAADAVAIADALLAANYLAHVGGHATWSFKAGATRVVLGFRDGISFVEVIVGNAAIRACDFDRIHIAHHAQADAELFLQRWRQTI